MLRNIFYLRKALRKALRKIFHFKGLQGLKRLSIFVSEIKN
jgi:hypothetical protein